MSVSINESGSTEGAMFALILVLVCDPYESAMFVLVCDPYESMVCVLEGKTPDVHREEGALCCICCLLKIAGLNSKPLEDCSDDRAKIRRNTSLCID